MSFSEDNSDNKSRRLQCKSSQGADGHSTMIYTDPDAYNSYNLSTASVSPSQRNLKYRNSANMNAIFGTEDPNCKYGLHYENSGLRTQIKDKGESNSSANMNAIFGTNNPTNKSSCLKSTIHRQTDNIGDIINDGCTIKRQETEEKIIDGAKHEYSLEVESTHQQTTTDQSTGTTPKVADPPALAPTPRKRVPPGGYSSGLW